MIYMKPNDGEQQPKLKRFNGAPEIMFPAKNSDHSLKPTHNEENKTVNFRMLLRGLTEKKRLNAQRIQNSKIWCPISITK